MYNSKENNYSDFTETDFVNDPFFQDWVINSTNEKDAFWNKVLNTNPAKKQQIQNAISFLRKVRFEEEVLDERYIHQQYLKHLRQVQTKEPAKVFGLQPKKIRIYASVAASVAAIILVTSTLLNNKATRVENVVVETKFGEIKKVFLPDGSSIVLNGHSNITFSKEWDTDKPREIWLNGEGFFDVKHINDNHSDIKPFKTFLVHGQDFTIEVLGTTFDIRQRRGKTEVVLQTGKIKLTLKDEKRSIIMVPGDFVSYMPKENAVVQSKAVPKNYSAWKEKKLVLSNPTLEEITNYLEDNYGKDIIIQNQKLKNKKIEGPIELNNLNDALFIISTVWNTDIQRKNNQIIIKSK